MNSYRDTWGHLPSLQSSCTTWYIIGILKVVQTDFFFSPAYFINNFLAQHSSGGKEDRVAKRLWIGETCVSQRLVFLLLSPQSSSQTQTPSPLCTCTPDAQASLCSSSRLQCGEGGNTASLGKWFDCRQLLQ